MNRNKKLAVGAFAAACAASIVSSAAFAAGWQKDNAGWRYGTNAANTTWHANGWQWLEQKMDRS